MSKESRDALFFWREAEDALDELIDAMQIFSCNLAQPEVLDLPPHTIKRTKRAIAKFQENFSLMVREQKRKAGR